ncbi:hypothetical protein A9Q83_11775 [Alphaproteobacteria bacterium 46_93_T64]|nr:hypothetical protein A9Q83_11775 [Alphaproteobacteria bacterium 46_93_T64]
MSIVSWKKAMLACSASLAISASIPATANAEVTVIRDQQGVPFINATTNREMWFALGYVQARDRIIQMELLRQAAFGELPILADDPSKDNTARDIRNHKLHHKYPNLRQNLTREYHSSTDIAGNIALECMAEGINSFKAALKLGPGVHENEKNTCLTKPFQESTFTAGEEHTVKPEEFLFIEKKTKELGLDPRPWTAIDIAGLFHLQVMDEFSNRNTELNNLKHLVELTSVYNEDPEAGVRVFNSMKWSLNRDAATTIPASPEEKRAADVMANTYHAKLIASVRPASQKFNGCTVYGLESLKASSAETSNYAMHKQSDSFPYQASNWWVISQAPFKAPGADLPTGIMYNGPQIAALDPSRTYQVALKSEEGFQFAGNTYPGTINFWQGHNGNLALGLTAGNIDVSDIFCVDLFRKADGTFFYNTENGGERNLQQTSNDPVLFHVADAEWPVVMIESNPAHQPGTPVGTAYIQRYNWQGATVSTLLNWIKALNATDIPTWNKHLDKVGGNFNLVALDGQNTGVPQYEYDPQQANLLLLANPENSPEQNAETLMMNSLMVAIDKMAKYPSFNAERYETGQQTYFQPEISTTSGLSTTIAAGDLKTGFRPGSINIRHFRNRGPLNIAVAFDGVAQGKNIAHPGVREYRAVDGAGDLNEAGNDYASNQIRMFGDNRYRDMHPLPPRKIKIRSKL